jgi:hypothetical protein
VGLKLNGANQLLAYADDMNLLEDNTDTIKKTPETLIAASSKEVGSKRNEVIERWNKLHKGELCDLYSSPSIIRIIKWGRMGGTCSLKGEEKHI